MGLVHMVSKISSSSNIMWGFFFFLDPDSWQQDSILSPPCALSMFSRFGFPIAPQDPDEAKTRFTHNIAQSPVKTISNTD